MRNLLGVEAQIGLNIGSQQQKERHRANPEPIIKRLTARCLAAQCDKRHAEGDDCTGSRLAVTHLQNPFSGEVIAARVARPQPAAEMPSGPRGVRSRSLARNAL